MTELKTDSQSTRTLQTQPTAKRQPNAAIAEPSSISESIVESNPEAPSTRKRRTAKTDKPPAKRQATSKSPNQSASTKVKLTWEPAPSIEDNLAQFNDQVNALWSAIDDLKATVEETHQAGTRSGVQLPLEAPAPPARSQTVLTKPIPPFRPTTSFPSARSRRQKPMARIIQRCLKLPKQNSEMAIDAALWVFAAAGLRYALKYLVIAVPILTLPLMLLMFVPALLAGYAALFIPQTNRVGIYRLLLVTLGLFVGGRL